VSLSIWNRCVIAVSLDDERSSNDTSSLISRRINLTDILIVNNDILGAVPLENEIVEEGLARDGVVVLREADICTPRLVEQLHQLRFRVPNVEHLEQGVFEPGLDCGLGLGRC